MRLRNLILAQGFYALRHIHTVYLVNHQCNVYRVYRALRYIPLTWIKVSVYPVEDLKGAQPAANSPTPFPQIFKFKVNHGLLFRKMKMIKRSNNFSHSQTNRWQNLWFFGLLWLGELSFFPPKKSLKFAPFY